MSLLGIVFKSTMVWNHLQPVRPITNISCLNINMRNKLWLTLTGYSSSKYFITFLFIYEEDENLKDRNSFYGLVNFLRKLFLTLPTFPVFLRTGKQFKRERQLLWKPEQETNIKQIQIGYSILWWYESWHIY